MNTTNTDFTEMHNEGSLSFDPHDENGNVIEIIDLRNEVSNKYIEESEEERKEREERESKPQIDNEIILDNKHKYDYTYATSGIPMIAERKYFFWGKFNKMYVLPNHEHALILGGSGSGKTQSLVFPLLQTILDAKENCVIHDCKLELFETFGKKFKDAGYNVIVINFSNPRYSHRWNPFHYPTREWKKILEKNHLRPHDFRKVKDQLSHAIELFKDCAINLCYEEDNDRNSYFWKGAGNMMAGGALLLAEEGRFDCINGLGLQMLYAMDTANEKKGTKLKEYISNCRNLNDDSTLQINVYLVADEMTRGNIESTFKQKIEILNGTPDIRYLTSGSDFELEDIFEKQTAVFVLTQDEKDQYYPLVTLFLKQLYETGVELTRHGKYKEWPYKMNWVLEEMGILPEIKNFKNIYNAARSRGLTIYGFMQSLADMIDKYELTGTKTIIENCRVQVFVHSDQADTRNFIIERCGKELFWDKRAKDWRERPLLTDSRLGLMEKGRIVITVAGQRPYIAKLPQYKQYTFYQEPDLRFIKSNEMFGELGRQYREGDVKWFTEDDYEASMTNHYEMRKYRNIPNEFHEMEREA